MKPFPWKCATCRSRTVNPSTLPLYEAELEHDGRKYSITIQDLHVFKCDGCGTIVLDDKAGERLNDALRDAVGLLKPAEIRCHREHLRLTQKELAALLRISESTLSRWETGGQIQQRSLDAFMRVVFHFAEVQSYLRTKSIPSVDAPAGRFDFNDLAWSVCSEMPQPLLTPEEAATVGPVARSRRPCPTSDREPKLRLVS